MLRKSAGHSYRGAPPKMPLCGSLTQQGWAESTAFTLSFKFSDWIWGLHLEATVTGDCA